MKQSVRLGDVPIGCDFEVWGRTFTVLDNRDGGIFALQTTVETEMHFCGEDKEHPLNNFGVSAIRKFLNGDYIESLRRSTCSPGELKLKYQDVDLKCAMGKREYGICTVKAGILTLEQYGIYENIIPPSEDPWWLATPWKVKPSSMGCKRAWVVRSLGNCGIRNCSKWYGVRPTLNLDPSILVDYEIEQETDVDLSNIPIKCLVDEIYKRAGGDKERVS